MTAFRIILAKDLRVELRSRKPTRVAMQEVLAGAVSWEMRDEVPEK